MYPSDEEVAVGPNAGSTGPGPSPPCPSDIFSGRYARMAVCVGLYFVLMVVLPSDPENLSDRAGMLGTESVNKAETDFGREISFKGFGIEIVEEGLGDDSGDDHGQKVIPENSGGLPDPGAKRDQGLTVTTLADKQPRRRGKDQHGKVKKRRPHMAQARSMGQISAPIFVPQEVKLETPKLDEWKRTAGRNHHKGHKIETFVLTEEYLKASPEDLLPPQRRIERDGPSTSAKIVALVAWVGLSILVLETGCREARRWFRYVRLRQARALSDHQL